MRPRFADEAGRRLDVIHARGPRGVVALVVPDVERTQTQVRAIERPRHVEVVGNEWGRAVVDRVHRVAIALTVSPMTTALKKNESAPCRSATRRIDGLVICTSETLNVVPSTNEKYKKSL